ncbi:hypothetical protein KCH_18380 [Kitasatospora cheerisanensis KCTC 2395]|uniref:Uncharacterized protein n=1 Tax=Kitasatospora cheerisanensis KCTC 2395 TaxID=1348663 RepID=A0A066Z6R1_9ACTN|nr:hypothetical protein KCH_18380 [Kitasatospora cheerisanensis KCTC 2395]
MAGAERGGRGHRGHRRPSRHHLRQREGRRTGALRARLRPRRLRRGDPRLGVGRVGPPGPGPGPGRRPRRAPRASPVGPRAPGRAPRGPPQARPEFPPGPGTRPYVTGTPAP